MSISSGDDAGKSRYPDEATPVEDDTSQTPGENRHYKVQQVEVDIDSATARSDLALRLAVNEQRYGLFGLILGALAVAGGGAMIVFTHTTGAVDFQVEYGSAKIHVVTAVVGILLALFGLSIIWMTRPKIKIKGATVDAAKVLGK